MRSAHNNIKSCNFVLFSRTVSLSKLVYELYGLTDEEIAIVEEASES